MPFASVIVPTYNRPTLLLRALASLVSQELSDWEAIVVDDGDGTGIDAAQSLGEPRVRALANTGTGQVDARNTAIEAARGDLICWLDDDDWWDDARHLSLLRAAAEGETALWFRGGWIVYEDGPRPRREAFDHDATPASLRRNNTVLTSSIAYPRTLHEHVGMLDRDLGGYCDWDFMLRCCAAGVVLRKLPGLATCYSVRGDNASAAFDAPARLVAFGRFASKHRLDILIANHVRIHRLLTAPPEGWQERDGALEREFRFPDFPGAIAFVNRVAELAETANHHPAIAVRYDRVVLRWWTHSAGGVTDRDRELAGRSAELA